MLEIAMDNKAVHNLGKDKASVKGSILKNSFDHLNDPKFLSIADQIGVEIDSSLAKVGEDLPTTSNINDSYGCHPSCVDVSVDGLCHFTSAAKHPSDTGFDPLTLVVTNDGSSCHPRSTKFP